MSSLLFSWIVFYLPTKGIQKNWLSWILFLQFLFPSDSLVSKELVCASCDTENWKKSMKVEKNVTFRRNIFYQLAACSLHDVTPPNTGNTRGYGGADCATATVGKCLSMLLKIMFFSFFVRRTSFFFSFSFFFVKETEKREWTSGVVKKIEGKEVGSKIKRGFL